MNFLLIIVGFILIWRIVEGYNRGMVKEIISFLSLIVASVLVVLIGIALSSYLDKQIARMVVAVILFLIICIVHRIVSFIFFSLKIITRLPVISFANRILGVLIGVLETVVIVWVMYALLMTFDLGVLGEQIMFYVRESKALSTLYRYNYLAKWIGNLNEQVDFFGLLESELKSLRNL